MAGFFLKNEQYIPVIGLGQNQPQQDNSTVVWVWISHNLVKIYRPVSWIKSSLDEYVLFIEAVFKQPNDLLYVPVIKLVKACFNDKYYWSASRLNEQ